MEKREFRVTIETDERNKVLDMKMFVDSVHSMRDLIVTHAKLMGRYDDLKLIEIVDMESGEVLTWYKTEVEKHV